MLPERLQPALSNTLIPGKGTGCEGGGKVVENRVACYCTATTDKSSRLAAPACERPVRIKCSTTALGCKLARQLANHRTEQTVPPDRSIAFSQTNLNTQTTRRLSSSNGFQKDNIKVINIYSLFYLLTRFAQPAAADAVT